MSSLKVISTLFRKKKTTVYPDEQHKGESVMCSLDDDKVVYPLVLLRVMELNAERC